MIQRDYSAISSTTSIGCPNPPSPKPPRPNPLTSLYTNLPTGTALLAAHCIKKISDKENDHPNAPNSTINELINATVSCRAWAISSGTDSTVTALPVQRNARNSGASLSNQASWIRTRTSSPFSPRFGTTGKLAFSTAISSLIDNHVSIFSILHWYLDRLTILSRVFRSCTGF